MARNRGLICLAGVMLTAMGALVSMDGVVSSPAHAQHIFVQPLDPVGVTTTADGTVFITALDPQTGLMAVMAFSPNGLLLRQLPLAGFPQHISLTTDPVTGWIVGLMEDGRLFVLEPTTLQGAFIFAGLSIRQLPVDASTIYDAETGTIGPLGGVVPPSAFYGDLAVLQRNDLIDLFVTGLSVSHPFIIRIRMVAASLTSLATQGPTFFSAQVLASSRAAPELNHAPGIAVNSQGTVLTTLPVCNGPTCSGGYYAAVAFGVDFPEGQGFLPQVLLNRRQFPSQGMTIDGGGNFWVATGLSGLLECGSGALALVPATLTTFSCAPLGENINSQDVAISPDNAFVYMTINNLHMVVRFP